MYFLVWVFTGALYSNSSYPPPKKKKRLLRAPLRLKSGVDFIETKLQLSLLSFPASHALALAALPGSRPARGAEDRLRPSPGGAGELCEHLKMQCPGLLCARSVTACQTAAFSFRHPQGQTPAFILCCTIFLSSEVTISGRLPEYFHVGVIKDTLCRTVPAVCSCFEQER